MNKLLFIISFIIVVFISAICKKDGNEGLSFCKCLSQIVDASQENPHAGANLSEA